ncbi:conserved hypothetical protein, partial [Ricinus communis]
MHPLERRACRPHVVAHADVLARVWRRLAQPRRGRCVDADAEAVQCRESLQRERVAAVQRPREPGYEAQGRQMAVFPAGRRAHQGRAAGRVESFLASGH